MTGAMRNKLFSTHVDEALAEVQLNCLGSELLWLYRDHTQALKRGKKLTSEWKKLIREADHSGLGRSMVAE